MVMVDPNWKPSKRKEASPVVVARYLNEKDWTCELCGQNGPLHLHHILPRSRGGKDEPDNWLLVCAWRCHKWIHENPKKAKEGGWLR